MPDPAPPPASAVAFAEAARRLGEVCRRHGLVAPGFRSPPADPAARRTIRHRPDGGVIVAVRVRGRPLADVLVDLVEGVLAANALPEEEAARLRRELLAGLSDLEGSPPARAA
ncbi:MAG: hypothetical protein ACLGI2_08020 [Acidimicrobiia bacterium]